MLETVMRLGPVVEIENHGLKDHDLYWVREITPKVSIYHGSMVVRTVDPIFDRDELIDPHTMLDRAIGVALGCCRIFEVDEKSTMYVTVKVDVHDVPFRRTRDLESNRYLTTTFDPISCMVDELIWSSKMVSGMNALIVKGFRDRWLNLV